LQNDIAPSDLPQEFECARPANYRERKIAAAFRLSDHAHFVSQSHKLAREKIRGGFYSARARKKMVRSE